MLCAFGDSGAMGAKPPLPACAAGVRRAAASAEAAKRVGFRRTGCHSMNVSEATHRRTRVRLPRDLTRPFEVFVNGVEQVEGVDFELDGRTLLFHRELKSEGKLGFWRWTSIFVGVAGTYRQDDSVDVVYERGGQRVVAAKLPREPLS